uniref:Chemokine interleukin-8-like domain-containing protein n=1 Tax=Cyprinus carpio TaxID=7962 RepID=A0A8C1ZMA4_CYPCA
MRNLMCFLLFLMIFCSVQMTSSYVIPIDAAPSKCCGEEFTVVKIPVKQVTSYFWTSSNFCVFSIRFQTIAGREFCVDPETPWVNGHIAKVDKRTTV